MRHSNVRGTISIAKRTGGAGASADRMPSSSAATAMPRLLAARPDVRTQHTSASRTSQSLCARASSEPKAQRTAPRAAALACGTAARSAASARPQSTRVPAGATPASGAASVQRSGLAQRLILASSATVPRTASTSPLSQLSGVGHTEDPLGSSSASTTVDFSFDACLWPSAIVHWLPPPTHPQTVLSGLPSLQACNGKGKSGHASKPGTNRCTWR
mmetsp:Transcript_113020/g.364941  ORF Transcript_113020/g.364941 Transcript_113020/m.364941 type:complete len:216 (-) Transcript_113020:19-666(-)